MQTQNKVVWLLTCGLDVQVDGGADSEDTDPEPLELKLDRVDSDQLIIFPETAEGHVSQVRTLFLPSVYIDETYARCGLQSCRDFLWVPATHGQAAWRPLLHDVGASAVLAWHYIGLMH